MSINRTLAQSKTALALREFAVITAQVALLWFVSWVGHEIVSLFHLPLPGNVAGLLLTFLALSCGVLPLRLVEQAAGLLIRNLALFFVPLAVGVVTQGHLIATHGFAILVTLIASAAIGFAVTGRVAQIVMRLQGQTTVAIRGHHAKNRHDRR